MNIVKDEKTGKEKKEGWIVGDFTTLGKTTVAQKIADAEGTSLDKTMSKLDKAEKVK